MTKIIEAFKVKLEDILDGIEFQTDESTAYLNKTTGKVILISDQ